jgi:hypothetical protein
MRENWRDNSLLLYIIKAAMQNGLFETLEKAVFVIVGCPGKGAGVFF